MIYGAYRSQNAHKNLSAVQVFFARFPSLPFDDAAGGICGRIRSELATLGTPIGPNDLMIASIVLAHDLILVTHNVDEFRRVGGLRIEDWEVS